MNQSQGNGDKGRDGHRSKTKTDSSVSTDISPESRPYSPRLRYNRPINAPSAMNWDGGARKSTMSFPSSYDPPPRCTNCFTLGCQLRNSQDTLHQVSSQLGAKALELDHTHKELIWCREELNQCDDEIHNLREQLEVLTDDHSHLQEESSELEAKCTLSDSKCSELEAKCTFYDSKCSELEAKCTFSDSKCSELEDRCSGLEVRCSGLEVRCSESEKRCSELEKRCSELEGKCSELEGKCSNSEKKCGILIEENVKLKKSVQNFVDDYKRSVLPSPQKVISKPENISPKVQLLCQDHHSTSSQLTTEQQYQPNGPKKIDNKLLKAEEEHLSLSSPPKDLRTNKTGRSAEACTSKPGKNTAIAYSHESVNADNNSWDSERRSPVKNDVLNDSSVSRDGKLRELCHSPRKTDNHIGDSRGTTSPMNSPIVPECLKTEKDFDFIKEVKDDLFDMTSDYALAHCVGSDFLMSSGVAVTFRSKFRSLAELLHQNKKPGEVAFLNKSGRYVYYLVTKTLSTGKPKWEDFKDAIVEWKNLCVEHRVKKIAVPKIGCGEDQLHWDEVQELLHKVFAKTGIEITVCVSLCEKSIKTWSVKQQHVKGPLSLIDPRDCAVVFIASKDRVLTTPIKRIAEKFGFLSDYVHQQLGMGSLYQHSGKAKDVNVFGLVVKDHANDPVSFGALARCLQDLKRVVSKSGFCCIALEAFVDVKYTIVTRKLWTLVTDAFYFNDLDIYFYWPVAEVSDLKSWGEPITSYDSIEPIVNC